MNKLKPKQLATIFCTTLLLGLIGPRRLPASVPTDFQRDSLLGITYYQKADAAWRNIDSCMHYSFLAIEYLKNTCQWEKYIFTLCGLNYCYNSREQYEEMEANNLLAYTEAKRYLTPEDETYYIALNNYALVQSEIKEDHLGALGLYKEAYDGLNGIKGEVNNSTRGGIEENIGQMYYFLGDFETAVDFYKKAEESFKNVRVDGQIKVPYIRVAKIHDKIAKVHYASADFREAWVYQQKSLSTLEESGIYDRNFSVRFEIDLAKTALSRQDQATALAILNRLSREDLTPIQRAKVLRYQGMANLRDGQPGLAEKQLLAGLGQKIAEDQALEKVKLNMALAELYTQTGQAERALAAQQETVRLLAPDAELGSLFALPPSGSFVKSSLQLFRVLKMKAGTLSELYEEHREKKYAKAAMDTYRYIGTLIDEIRSFYLSRESQLFLLEDVKDYFETAIQLAHDLYEQEGRLEYLDHAFAFMEKSKSNLLLDELRKQEFGDEMLANDLLREEYRLRSLINYSRKRIRQEETKGTDRDVDKIKAINNEIFGYQYELGQLLDHINRHYTKYSEISQRQPIALADMQQQLRLSETVLEYFVGREYIYLFVITPEKVDLKKIANDVPLDELVSRLFQNLKMSGRMGAEDYGLAAFRLYEKLLLPAGLEPESDRDLIVIPDGEIENLPFDILLSEKPDVATPRKLAYLIRDYTFSYAYSATVLVHQKSQRPPEKSAILGIFPTFRGSGKELLYSEEMYQMLSGYEGTYLRDRKADASGFLQAVSRADIVHFDTHARGNDDTYHEPAIDLFDRSLLLSDLQNRKLAIHLAVLSACETNVGEYREGEGIMSLSRGFTYAGIPSVITSVTRVFERSTSEIMQRFYENLEKGMRKHDALRAAKLDYLQTAPTATGTPYYWGTFLAIGNMDTVHLTRRPAISLSSLAPVGLALLLLVGGLLQYRKLRLGNQVE